MHIHGGLFTHKKKKKDLAICGEMDGTWRHYVKWNRSHRERETL